MKRFLYNILCCFVPSKKFRHQLRLRAKYDIGACVAFALRDYNQPHARVKLYMGHGTNRVVIVVNGGGAYKFGLSGHNIERECLLMRELGHIPSEIIYFDKMPVMKYKFMSGKIITDFPPEKITYKIATKIGNQLAQIIYDIARSDPSSLRHLKQKPSDAPGIYYGWFHNDLGGNFLLDEKTFNVVALIDWEAAKFFNFRDAIVNDKYLTDHGFGNVHAALVKKLDALYGIK